MIHESVWYKTKYSIGLGIAVNVRIGFKHQVTAMPGFYWLNDWCFQTMWLFSGVREDTEDDTVMGKHCAEALYPAVKCLMHAICIKDHNTKKDAVDGMIQIAMSWMIRRWLELNLVNGIRFLQIPKENANLVDLEWTVEEQPKLKTLVERYASQGALEVWRVHWWQLACFSLVLGDTDDQNDISGQLYDEWPLDTWMDCPIFRWLRDTFLPMLVDSPREYPKPDKGKASNQVLLHRPESINSALLCAPPPPKAVPFCPLPGDVRHLKQWLRKSFADHLDILYMYAEMGNDERSKLQLKIQDSPNTSVFAITFNVGGPSPKLPAANDAVTTQKFWVLNEQWQAFAQVVHRGQSRAAYTEQLNTGQSGYDNSTSDIHQLSAVAQIRVLPDVMSCQNIMTSLMNQILQCREDHMM